MSLPPQILRIKRKRADDPVDSLYIEEASHKSKTKRQVTEQDFVFRRLITNEDKANILGNTPESKSSHPLNSIDVPAIMPNLPTEVGISLQSNDAKVQNDLQGHQAGEGFGLPGPKRFHLSRLSATVAANQSALSIIRKRRRDQRTNIAVFEERQPSNVAAKKSDPSPLSRPTLESDAQKLAPLTNQSPRKRPGATAAISKSASSNSLRRMEKEDAEATKTRLALQKYAMEELESSAGHEKVEAEVKHEIGTRDLGHDPDAMETDGSDNEYIYDTYVRHAYNASEINDSKRADKLKKAHTSSEDSSQLALIDGTETFGYIILPPRPSSGPGATGTTDDTSAEFWGTFGELVDEGSSSEEADWDTEQDDENAENFYGADYPEDELDSDDERGDQAVGYARFRGRGKGVSDDEDEYGNFRAGENDIDYDAFDMHNTWNMKHRGRVWRLGGTSSYDHGVNDGSYIDGEEADNENDHDDEV